MARKLPRLLLLTRCHTLGLDGKQENQFSLRRKVPRFWTAHPPRFWSAAYTRRKWGGFFLNAVLYGIACACVLTIVGIMAAPLFWLLAVGHAGFTYRKELMAVHADMIATKMAEKLNANPKRPV